jgi:hypothetical protein
MDGIENFYNGMEGIVSYNLHTSFVPKEAENFKNFSDFISKSSFKFCKQKIRAEKFPTLH